MLLRKGSGENCKQIFKDQRDIYKLVTFEKTRTCLNQKTQSRAVNNKVTTAVLYSFHKQSMKWPY